MLSYNRGILYSKAICDFLADREDLRDYDIFVNTFCTWAQSGFMFTIYGRRTPNKGIEYKEPISFWAHADEGNDEIFVLRWGTIHDYTEEETHFARIYSKKIKDEQTATFQTFNPCEIAEFIMKKASSYFRAQE